MVDLLGQILLSIFLGAFIGLEREYHKGKIGAGVRTTSFICLFGTLTTFYAFYYNAPLAVFLGLSIVSAFALMLFWYRSRVQRHAGLTTSAALILTYFIGSLVSLELFREAIALAVIIFLLLFSKKRLVGKIRHLTDQEIFNAIEFAIIAFVVYPFLPDYSLLGVGIREAWTVVLVVSAVSFLGFLAMRHFGDRKGVVFSSVLGSILSSSAVVVSSVRDYRKNKPLLNLFVLSCITAFVVMAVRNFLVASFLAGSPEVLMIFAKAIAASVLYLLAVFCLLRKMPSKRFVRNMESPFAIRPAFYFGIIFFMVLAFSRFAVSYLGPEAILPISVIGGMGSGYAVAASLALLFSQGAISSSVFAGSLVAAIIGGMLADTATIYAFRQAKLANRVLLLALLFSAVLVFSVLHYSK